MTIKGFLTFFAFLTVFALVAPLGAQQEGSVAIAGEITPSAENIVSDGITCLADAAKVLAPKKAAKYCENLAKLTAKTSTRIANESADATKASRPMVISPGYGYGSGGYYGGYSYGYSRSYIVRPARRAPVRVAPRASKSRPTVSRSPVRSSAPTVRRASVRSSRSR